MRLVCSSPAGRSSRLTANAPQCKRIVVASQKKKFSGNVAAQLVARHQLLLSDNYASHAKCSTPVKKRIAWFSCCLCCCLIAKPLATFCYCYKLLLLTFRLARWLSTWIRAKLLQKYYNFLLIFHLSARRLEFCCESVLNSGSWVWEKINLSGKAKLKTKMKSNSRK